MRPDAGLVELVGDHGESHALVEACRAHAGVAPHEVATAGRDPRQPVDNEEASGARPADGAVVGVVRFSPAPCPWRPLARAPWQLRGMATEAAVRGSGAGRLLVIDGLERVTARGGDLVWCDARVSAAGFYERMGFTVVTEEFDKPGIGPHVGMCKDL